MTGPISEAFAGVLRSGRDALNAEFAHARKVYPGLSGDAFLEFLRGAVDPLVVQVARVKPDRATATAISAYGIALSLVGQRVVGAGGPGRAVEAGWRMLLPKLATHVADSPDAVIGAVSNALHNLESLGARAGEWLASMERVGPACADVPSLLAAGQVCAWRAGASHLRKGALLAADTLPESLAVLALGAAPDAAWPDLRARLASDPWYYPGAPPSPRYSALVGAFSGFGGLFVEPPRVRASDEYFVVTSRDAAWLVVADAFGSTLHRATPAEVAMSSEAALPQGVAYDKGRVSVNGIAVDVPASGALTSAAANRHTIALTFAFSHSIVLVSRGASA